jgi:hypothetical protein
VSSIEDPDYLSQRRKDAKVGREKKKKFFARLALLARENDRNNDFPPRL